MKIKRLNQELANLCEEQFSQIGWSKPQGHFHNYFTAQESGKIVVFVSYDQHQYCGHIKLVWSPDYRHFLDNSIPEIQDLNVLPTYRKQGIGTALIKFCEQLASERSKIVGIGVGLHPGYNNAQRLYPSLGYIPDGHGVHYNNRPVETGGTYRFDDELVLFFTKVLTFKK